MDTTEKSLTDAEISARMINVWNSPTEVLAPIPVRSVALGNVSVTLEDVSLIREPAILPTELQRMIDSFHLTHLKTKRHSTKRNSHPQLDDNSTKRSRTMKVKPSLSIL